MEKPDKIDMDKKPNKEEDSMAIELSSTGLISMREFTDQDNFLKRQKKAEKYRRKIAKEINAIHSPIAEEQSKQIFSNLIGIMLDSMKDDVYSDVFNDFYDAFKSILK